ncbi:putative aldouronate transport system substrate-binding protein [Cohnella sp. OV330]|uniref:extracellular solute-binding protein n=1 Tax=Cohnella sp. OV330 TaxID=1855288 RepID=UPI0008E5CEDB|nr:extracellular solute-binding protein [Cohnella sp. OV330]SFB08585.1 putative aldouronate transport system substrate-binding protein [Cohnella sp. OV330]
MKRQRVSTILLSLALVSALAACSGNNGNKADHQASGSASASAGSAGSAGSATASGEEAAPADPLGKYDPPIEVSAVRPISEGTKFGEGESIDDNVWSRAYADQLGIKINYLWTTPAAQYDQKLNIAIASNDLPDIMSVNAAQLKRLVDDGQVMDLSAVYDQYGSELTKKLLGEDGGNALKSGTFDGKLYGFPKMSSGLGQADVLWVRTDWLTKLGLSEPKTMDDVQKIAEAFVKQDPDGNGKPDTYGLGATKDIFGFFGALEGFFNGYHAYPNIWVKTDDGKLAYGSVQPETKAALQKLQEMYKGGLIDKEFGTKDATKVKDAANAGKLGLFYGYFWNAGWLLDGKKTDAAMDWKPISLPSVDAEPAQAQVPFAISTYYVVKKDAKHPEAAVKLLNFDLEKLWGKSAEPEVYNADKSGNAVFEYALLYGEAPRKNLDAYLNVVKALEANDPAALNAEEKSYYDKIVSYRGGDVNFWDSEKMYGPEGSLAVIEGYAKDGAHTDDAFYGAPTQGMTDNNATLGKLQLEAFTRIMMGGSIDEFDQFVSQWNSLGGKAITDEVNAWQASQ